MNDSLALLHLDRAERLVRVTILQPFSSNTAGLPPHVLGGVVVDHLHHVSCALDDADPGTRIHAGTNLLELFALVHRVLGAKDKQHIESPGQVEDDLLAAFAVVEERVADEHNCLGLRGVGGEGSGGTGTHATATNVGSVTLVLCHRLVACNTVLQVGLCLVDNDRRELGESVCEALGCVVVQSATGTVGPEHERLAAGLAVLTLSGDGLAIELDLEGAVHVLAGVAGAISAVRGSLRSVLRCLLAVALLLLSVLGLLLAILLLLLLAVLRLLLVVLGLLLRLVVLVVVARVGAGTIVALLLLLLLLLGLLVVIIVELLLDGLKPLLQLAEKSRHRDGTLFAFGVVCRPDSRQWP